jgi:hypothetical protein
MSARFALVTPVRPRAAKSAAVNGGEDVPPAAVNMIAATMSARELNSLTVSTLVAEEASTTSLSREAAAAETI